MELHGRRGSWQGIHQVAEAAASGFGASAFLHVSIEEPSQMQPSSPAVLAIGSSVPKTLSYLMPGMRPLYNLCGGVHWPLYCSYPSYRSVGWNQHSVQGSAAFRN